MLVKMYCTASKTHTKRICHETLPLHMSSSQYPLRTRTHARTRTHTHTHEHSLSGLLDEPLLMLCVQFLQVVQSHAGLLGPSPAAQALQARLGYREDTHGMPPSYKSSLGWMSMMAHTPCLFQPSRLTVCVLALVANTDQISFFCLLFCVPSPAM